MFQKTIILKKREMFILFLLKKMFQKKQMAVWYYF